MPIKQFRMTGWNPDQEPSMLPDDQWSDVNDMVHRDGRYQKVAGVFDHGSQTASISHLLNLPAPDTASINRLNNYWIWGGRVGGVAKIYIHDQIDDDETDITDVAGGLADTGRADDWTSGIVNGFPVFTTDTAKDNAGASDMVYWPRTETASVPDPCVTLPGQRSNYRVRSIAVHRNHIFGLSTISTANGHIPAEVIWSGAAAKNAVPTTWVPAAGNEAGDVVLGDSGDAVMDALSFGNRLLIYKNASVYSAEYIGGNAVFAFRKLSDQVGVMARHCIQNVGQRQFILTPFDIVEFDGVQFRSICDQVTRRTIFDKLYATNVRQWAAFVSYNPLFSEIWITVPEASSEQGTEIYVYNVNTGKWGYRDFDWTASGVNGMNCSRWGWRYDEGLADGSEPVQSMHVGTGPDTKIIEVDRSETGPGGDLIGWSLERKGLDFGDRNRRKQVKRIWPIYDSDYSSPTLTVQITARDNKADAGSAQSLTTTFDPDADEYVDATDGTDRALSGKLFDFRFNDASGGLDKFWGFDVEWEDAGEW